MTTLVIDRRILPEPLLSFIGADRIRVEGEADRIVLTPAREYSLADRPDPADYDNDTDYLNAIPGMAESIIRSMNAPMSEFEDIPRNRNSRGNV